MRPILALVLAGSVMLSACATTPALHMDEGKAIAATWTALDAASAALDPLVKAGVTTKAENAMIALNAPKIIYALTAATTAYHANDNASAAANVSAATAILATLTQIVAEKGAKP